MPRMTSAEYELYLMRQRGLAQDPSYLPMGDDTDDESKLHNEIIDYCKAQDWVYFHSSMAHKTRRTLGEPDFEIYADAPRHWLIECKKKDEKPSPAQVILHARLAKKGWIVHVIRSMAEFIAVVTPPLDNQNHQPKG